MTQARVVKDTLGRQINRLATSLATDELPEIVRPATEAMLLKTIDYFGKVDGPLRRLAASGGRLVQSWNISVKGFDAGVDVGLTDALEALQRAGISDTAKKSVYQRLALAGSNPKAIRAAVEMEKGMGRRLGEAGVEYYINGLLSGPGTFAINAISTGIQTVLLPFERGLGGALRGDMVQVRQAAGTYIRLFRAMKDSLKMGLRAFATGTSPLTGDTAYRAISSEALGVDKSGMVGSWLAPVVDFLGGVARLPSRALGGADEVFKQMVYRTELYEEMTDEALAKGILESGWNGKVGAAAVGDYAEEAVHNYIASGKLSSRSLRQSQRSTFTEPLAKGSIPKAIENIVNSTPVLRVVVPFIRTPLNVLREAVGRTPLVNQVLASHRAALAKGGREAAEVTGKIAFSNMLYMGAVTAALSGTLNGSGGGLTKQERDRKMLNGWRPYSVKLGDKYIEFGRLDPLGAVLGLAADYAEIVANVKPEDQRNIFDTMWVALTANITNKTYLKGLSDVIDALTDSSGRDSSSFVQRFTATALIPSLIKNTNPDPHLREARTVVDAVMARTWGSTELMPRRDVLGQPIASPQDLIPGLPGNLSGIRMSLADDSPVRTALSSLPVSASAPSPMLSGGIDTTFFRSKSGQTAHDRMQELTGVVKIGGKALEVRLQEIVESARFKALEQTDYTGEARAALLEKQIHRYRAKAKKSMLKEFPELAEVIRQQKRIIIDARIAARQENFKSWLESNN